MFLSTALVAVLSLSVFTTIGYIVIQFEEIAGEIGLCKLQVLQGANDETYRDEVQFRSALMFCDK